MTDFGTGQSLIDGIGAAIRDPHPLALLELASALAQVTAPDPFHALRGAKTSSRERVERDDLIESFLDVGARETDALLLVWAEMLGDEKLRERVKREVRQRRHPLPRWLQHLDEVKPVRAIKNTHVLGDGDNVVLGVETPGRSFTLVLYIDHNMGTIVKDVFVIDRPISEVMMQLDSVRDDDTTLQELLLEDASAKVEQAVETTESIFPPYETDTWPRLKPLIDWMLRLLPSGGEGYGYEELSDIELDRITDGFMSSSFAAGLGKDAEDQARTLLNFAANYGTGDPLRWSNVVAEVMLLDLIPRKIIADQKYLRGIPDVMRALIRYSHDSQRIPARYTAEALAAVDEMESDYREAISTPHRQGPEALLERMGVLPPLDDDDADWDRDPDMSDEEYFLGRVAQAVGGLDALNALTTTPLPDEELDLTGVDTDILAKVQNISALADAACTEYFDDVELRTVMRRILPRIASADPAIFRRRSRDDTAAAAVTWIAAKANDRLSHSGSGTVTAMMAHFGLSGSPSQRAQPMLRALGVDGWAYDIDLGDPELLTSTAREGIIRRRDYWREQSRSE